MLITKNPEEKLLLYDKLNTTHKSVTFAKECESKYQLSFLDGLVVKRDSNVLVKV